MSNERRGDSQPARDPRALPTGTVLAGKYRLLRGIGEGGMAVIYHAEELRQRLDRESTGVGAGRPPGTPLGAGLSSKHRPWRELALKVIKELPDREAIQDFEREARTLGRLRCVHTVTLLDYGRADDLYFLAMELLDGHSVEEVLRAEGPLPWRRCLEMVKQAAASLQEAHQHGIYHRDIKPANLFLVGTASAGDFVKVLDFGLAKLPRSLGSFVSLTERNKIPGTPEYWAPEQVDGSSIDARTDLYSLGITLYEMLTGVTPFHAEGDGNETIVLLAMRHLKSTPPPLKTSAPTLNAPPELQQLMDALLAKVPKDRVGSAAELRQRIDEILELSAVRQRVFPAAAIVAIVAVLALVGALVAWRLWLMTPGAAEQPLRPAVSAPAEPSDEGGGGNGSGY